MKLVSRVDPTGVDVEAKQMTMTAVFRENQHVTFGMPGWPQQNGEPAR